MKELNYKEIGKRIKIKRKEMNLTQEKLSEIIDVSPSYISEIERGSSICSLATITNIADTLNTNLDYLVLGITRINANQMFTDILNSIPDENQKLYINLLEKDKNEIDKWIKVFVQEDVWDILDEIKNTFTDLRYNFIKEKVKDINMKKLLEFTFKIQNVASFEIVGYDVYRFPKGKPTKKDEDEYLDNFVRKNFMINKN